MKSTRVEGTPVPEPRKTEHWMSSGSHVFSWPQGTMPEGEPVPEHIERFGRLLLEAAVELKADYVAASFTKTRAIVEIGMPEAMAAEILAKQRWKP